MTNTKYILCLLVICLTCGCLQARIQLKSVNPVTTAGNCDGSLVIEASGEAGPFTVRIPGTDFIDENVAGIIVAPGLCAGTYTVEVTTNSRFECSLTLTAEIGVGFAALTGDDGGDTQLKLPAAPVSAREEADFILYPNPTDGRLKVRLEGFRQAPVQLTFYAGSGQQVHRFRDFTQEEQIIALDLTTLPPGTYFAILQDQEGKTYTKQLVIRP